MTQQFSIVHLCVTSQRTVILGGRETYKVSLKVVPDDSLGRVSRLQQGQGKAKWSPADPWVKETEIRAGSWSSHGRGPEERAVHKEVWRRVEDSPQGFNRVLTSGWLCGNYPRLRKEPPRKIRGNSIQSPQKHLCPFFPTTLRKPIIHQANET